MKEQETKWMKLQWRTAKDRERVTEWQASDAPWFAKRLARKLGFEFEAERVAWKIEGPDRLCQFFIDGAPITDAQAKVLGELVESASELPPQVVIRLFPEEKPFRKGDHLN